MSRSSNTILAVLVSAGIQVLIFGRMVTAVSTAVGVVCGMAAARQVTLKQRESKQQKESSE